MVIAMLTGDQPKVVAEVSVQLLSDGKGPVRVHVPPQANLAVLTILNQIQAGLIQALAAAMAPKPGVVGEAPVGFDPKRVVQ